MSLDILNILDKGLTVAQQVNSTIQRYNETKDTIEQGTQEEIEAKIAAVSAEYDNTFQRVQGKLRG